MHMKGLNCMIWSLERPEHALELHMFWCHGIDPLWVKWPMDLTAWCEIFISRCAFVICSLPSVMGYIWFFCGWTNINQFWNFDAWMVSDGYPEFGDNILPLAPYPVLLETFKPLAFVNHMEWWLLFDPWSEVMIIYCDEWDFISAMQMGVITHTPDHYVITFVWRYMCRSHPHVWTQWI